MVYFLTDLLNVVLNMDYYDHISGYSKIKLFGWIFYLSRNSIASIHTIN
jgi:hypothetical protein